MNVLRIGDHQLQLPARANSTDLGIDVRTTVAKTLQPFERFRFPTGFAWEFPADFGGEVWPRSGLADKHGIHVLGGLIDAEYHGEVQVILINLGSEPVHFDVGDRIAQVKLTPLLHSLRDNVYSGEQREFFTEVCRFESVTARGANGFGSTGMN